MPKAKFLGPDVDLGRFGPVKAGDVLDLNDDEAAMLKADGDKRFQFEGEKAPESTADATVEQSEAPVEEAKSKKKK